MCSHRSLIIFPPIKTRTTANPSSRKRKRSMTPPPQAAERPPGGSAPPPFDYLSPADKNENDCQPLIQETQTVDDPRQQEIERSQPQNREHVRSVDNKGILGNAKHRGDGVDSQSHVGDLDDEKNEKQRRSEQLARMAHEKMLAVVVMTYTKMLAGKAENP